MEDNEKLEEYRQKRKIRCRKIMIKRLGFTFISLLLTIALIFAIISFCKGLFPNICSNQSFKGFGVSKKVEKAMELEIPDWIDKQIINIHSTARTSAKLNDVKSIVIHYVGNAGSTAQNNRDYFNKFSTSVSSHFVVGLDGEIIQCVPLYERSAASNNRNKDTISVEVCHPDNTGRFNQKTYSAVIKLCVWLCKEFTLDETKIIRHYDITEKICPKYYVENPTEWKKFKQDVKEGLD